MQMWKDFKASLFYSPETELTVDWAGMELEEEYIQDKDLGICDLEFPYQVPDDTYFLVGDERVSSVDSRHSSVGCIPKEDIVGKIVYRIWPLDMVGAIK